MFIVEVLSKKVIAVRVPVRLLGAMWKQQQQKKKKLFLIILATWLAKNEGKRRGLKRNKLSLSLEMFLFLYLPLGCNSRVVVVFRLLRLLPISHVQNSSSVAATIRLACQEGNKSVEEERKKLRARNTKNPRQQYANWYADFVSHDVSGLVTNSAQQNRNCWIFLPWPSFFIPNLLWSQDV